MSGLRSTARGACALLVAISASVALVACAGPDAEEMRSSAQAGFAELLGAAQQIDPAVLRTLEVSDPEVSSCDDGAGEQTAFIAVGSVSVGADSAAEAALVDAVAEAVDLQVWTPIEPAGSADREAAWTDEAGIVATVSYDSPILVLAAFTPCIRLP